MAHPWIAKYKEQKIRAEWGYSDSENDSIDLDDEDQLLEGTSPKIDLSKIDSQQINNQALDINNYEQAQISDNNMIRLNQKSFHIDGGITPIKHSSDMNLRKKKTIVEYRIKTVSKSPQKPPV